MKLGGTAEVDNTPVLSFGRAGFLVYRTDSLLIMLYQDMM